ncbi:MAG TPA: FAD-dependent oxidoreductase [Actinomycetales bacterium]|nr:FAD-dependent oxidoreductase [Actinomycetales bacterium]
MTQQSSTTQVSEVVVVGGGLAGAKTVETLRKEGYDGSIVLLTAEDEIPYDRPPLSKEYLQGKKGEDDIRVLSPDWYAEHAVDLRLATTASALDLDAHRVALSSGEQLPFDRLLLATGSEPRHLPLPGADLEGVLTLRTRADSDHLREALQPGRHYVVIGGGWIGLETAAAGRLAGADVTVLEREDLPLLAVLGPELARVFADLHREQGVDLRTTVGVSEIVADGSGTRVAGVRLSDGTVVPADTVVVGVGAAPRVDLARDAGLDVDNGVLVDAQLRTSHPDVFAAGDIANAEHPMLGHRVRVEHWANALNQPTVAAATMLGRDERYDRLPYFYTDQYDLGMEYTGFVTPGGYDRVVVRGDAASREFIAFWMSGDAVLAGMNVNVWDVVDDIKALVQHSFSGGRVDPERLADPDIPLPDLIPSPDSLSS